MPRSGTTWLGKIFDSHPDTLYRHEPDSFGRLNFMPIAPEPDEAPLYARQLEDFVRTLPALRDTKIAASLPSFAKSYLSYPQHLWNEFAIRLAKLEAKFKGEAHARLWLPASATRHARVLWKSIESVSRLGIITSALPQAVGVLIIRHPCGYVASVIRGKSQKRFTDGESVGEDIPLLALLARTRIANEYGITLQRLRQAPPIERLAWQWVLCNDKALVETAGGNRILTIRYEDLCQNPEAVTRRMFDWTGLEFNAQTHAFIKASTRTHQSRYYSVFKNPEIAAHSWRSSLSQEIQRAVYRVVAETRAGNLFLDGSNKDLIERSNTRGKPEPAPSEHE
ncbi:MAG: sulfotransferase [Nitrococcus mobilis]|nr:sulfotransferase [Nitrococcus mobilis]